MKKTINILLLTLITQANAVDDDFAYRLVSEKLNGAIPDEFVRAAFSHEGVEVHKEIAEKFAKPYEKKPWSDYRKIFVKESRISAGAKFYSENKDLINVADNNDTGKNVAKVSEVAFAREAIIPSPGGRNRSFKKISCLLSQPLFCIKNETGNFLSTKTELG